MAAASCALAFGNTRRPRSSDLAPSAIERAPLTPRSPPSSESSPTTPAPTNFSAGKEPEAARIANAIGRSKATPSLRRFAGARLTITFLVGNLYPLFEMATRTLSLASCTAASGRPRSEEHTSELQSRQYLVCRLLLEKKTQTYNPSTPSLNSASPPITPQPLVILFLSSYSCHLSHSCFSSPFPPNQLLCPPYVSLTTP